VGDILEPVEEDIVLNVVKLLNFLLL